MVFFAGLDCTDHVPPNLRARGAILTNPLPVTSRTLSTVVSTVIQHGMTSTIFYLNRGRPDTEILSSSMRMKEERSVTVIYGVAS